MRNVNKIIAVATAVLAVTFGSMSASAGGHHDRHNNNRPNYNHGDGGYTARIVIGSLGSGLFYDLQPYRQPSHYRQPGRNRHVERRRGHRGHHHYRHNRRHHNYRQDHHRRGHHGQRGHHSRRH